MNEPQPPIDEDLEVELARQLVETQGLNQTNNGLKPSIAERLSPEEREKFRRAQECLDLLQFASPPPTDQVLHSTARGETLPIFSDLESCTLPDQLGHFQIVRELGRGGFGIILLANDTALGRQVALKIPLVNGLLIPESQKRFEREAKAAAALSHPAIVPIYETGSFGIINYIAFEYCEGTTLAAWLQQHPGPIEPRLAARIVQRLAEAVQNAHSSDVIHRDLKPGNILIAGTNSDKEAGVNLVDSLRITDFGLASLADDQQDLTRDGALLGTPRISGP